jgi:hypothetical protein
MTDVSPRQKRQERIEQTRPEAERLAALVKHQSLQEMVQLAVRDLDEGLQWLKQPGIGRRPSILQIVDMTTELAEFRLSVVHEIVKERGADAGLFYV